MIVYRERARRIPTAGMLERIHQKLEEWEGSVPLPLAQARELLIEFGRFESAVSDALNPERDELTPLAWLLREAGLETGRIFVDAWLQKPARPFSGLRRALRWIAGEELPASIDIKDEEGFSFYGLYPETYAEAVLRWAAERAPESAACIGIRGIGASLSSVAAAALETRGCRIRAFTVRPRGHPFDRRLVLGDELRNELRALRDTNFAVVDEGPGLSGSSLACVSRALRELGAPAGHIHFFPHWIPDPGQLCSEAAREEWRRNAAHTVSMEELWECSGRLERALGRGKLRNVSGGAWRKLLFKREADYPAVQPQHERRKYLTESGDVLAKFSGFGEGAERGFLRLSQVAEAGWTPAPLARIEGFTLTRYAAGQPCAPGGASAELLEAAAQYLVFRAREFPCSDAPPWEDLRRMMLVNTAELLGPEWADRLEEPLEMARDEVRAGTTVHIDARMMAHEWIQTDGGFLKMDAVDHCGDHFFPGPQDILWDAAAAEAEFSLEASAIKHFRALLEKYLGRVPERRWWFYSSAYLAYRAGYCRMAADALGDTADGNRFRCLAGGHAGQLARQIEAGGSFRRPASFRRSG